MREVGSYVEQDDALLGVLTVEETITYAARLRCVPTTSPRRPPNLRCIASSLPYDVPHETTKHLVQSTMRSLGLTDIAHNRIGTPIQRGISGGQKRRVTIACSVVAQPKILLCDEPTSGLDSMTSYQVISSSASLSSFEWYQN